MTSWFSKVFTPAPSAEGGEETPTPASPALKQRRVVDPVPVVHQPPSVAEQAPRIRARITPEDDTVVLLCDGPVLPGHSFWAPDRDTANAGSPMAASLFDLGGVRSVLIHGNSLTVVLDPGGATEDRARELGAQVRAQLASRMPVVHPEVVANLPSPEEIRSRLQEVIDDELNPAIAGHGGFIELTRVEGNTVYLVMGGGCQGCAASSYTLRQGVERAFRAAVPAVGGILDETDHAAGTNPFFSESPSGMGG